MQNIISQLQNEGYTVVKTRTICANNSSFYQVKDSQGVVYPKSKGSKQDIGKNTILQCYNTFGILGVKKLFGIN